LRSAQAERGTIPLSTLLSAENGKYPAAIRCRLPASPNSDEDNAMELVLIIVLLIILLGGGFGFYRGGYYRQSGPARIGGILGLVLIVLVIVWLLSGTLAGFSR
jgi:hypothetical protein